LLRFHISLRSKQTDVQDIQHTLEFRLNCKQRSFSFKAEDEQLKLKWMEDINGSITGAHEERQKQISKDRVNLFSATQQKDIVEIEKLDISTPLEMGNGNTNEITSQKSPRSINSDPLKKRNKPVNSNPPTTPTMNSNLLIDFSTPSTTSVFSAPLFPNPVFTTSVPNQSTTNQSTQNPSSQNPFFQDFNPFATTSDTKVSSSFNPFLTPNVQSVNTTPQNNTTTSNSNPFLESTDVNAKTNFLYF